MKAKSKKHSQQHADTTTVLPKKKKVISHCQPIHKNEYHFRHQKPSTPIKHPQKSAQHILEQPIQMSETQPLEPLLQVPYLGKNVINR